MDKTLIKSAIQVFHFITFLTLVTSCYNDNHKPQQGTSVLIDHGNIPVMAHGHSDFTSNEFQIAAYNSHFAFVNRFDGLLKNKLKTKEWSIYGFDSKKVSRTFRQPAIENKHFTGTSAENTPKKSLNIFDNCRKTWTIIQSPFHSDLDKLYKGYVNLALRAKNLNQINTHFESGTMIAVSTDGRLNWKRIILVTEVLLLFYHPSCAKSSRK